MYNGFTFNGKNSTDLGIFIDSSYTVTTAAPNVSTATIPGRAGTVLLNDSKPSSILQTIPFYVNKPPVEQTEAITQITNWLRQSVNVYHNFKLANDPGFTYLVAMTGELSFKREASDLSGELNALFYPYKFYDEGLKEINVTNGQTLNNPGTVTALPRIALSGSGTVTLNTFKMTGIGNGAVLDSEKQSCTNLAHTEPLFNRMSGDFLTLPPGNTKITWDNSDFTVKIIPRWGVMI